ncbi:MAG: hypothetical protein LLG06_12195 [Desulfobacteraceae bacterium]|nr:hypothetical protein [Desulfobacteraceae bacterium]
MMHRVLKAVACLAFFFALPATQLLARPLFFDMGKLDSPVRENFTQVTTQTAYSPSSGFGWKHTDDLKAFDQPYSKWVHNGRYDHEAPPPIFTSALTEDVIYGDTPNEFIVDVPPGKYRVYTISGRSSGSSRDYYAFNIVTADQSHKVEIPGNQIFERRRFNVRATGGQIRIKLQPVTTWLLSAVLIYPEADRNRVEREVIAPIEQEISLMPPDEWKKWEDIRPPGKPADPLPTSAERAKGFIVSANNCLEPIFPDTFPPKEERRTSLALLGAPGEYESGSFVVLPLRDLEKCEVALSPLQGPGVIPKTEIEVRSVRYMLAKPTYLELHKYLKVPDILEPLRALSLRRNITQQYWVTVKIPGKAAPGTYRGKITFSAKTGKAAIDAALDVLPTRLSKDPEIVYGMYYRDPLARLHPENKKEANAYFSRKAELERIDMANHGIDAHDSSVAFRDWNTFAVDVEDMRRKLDLDSKYGLNKRAVVLSFPDDWQKRLLAKVKDIGKGGGAPEEPSPAFFEELTRMVRAVEKERKARGWPEFLYYPIDEPKKDAKSVAFTARTLEAVKRVEGVRTFVTANPARKEFDPLWPHVDIWCSQPFAFDADTVSRLSREKKIEFWCYPNHISGETGRTHFAAARMTWGFGLWRSGYKAVFPWIYQYVAGDPFNYLDGPVMDFMNRSTPAGEPVPVIPWEIFRQGIVDGKYIYTLRKLIEEAKAGNSPERRARAEQAEADLKAIWDAVPVREKYIEEGVWNSTQFDRFRRIIADHIAALAH